MSWGAGSLRHLHIVGGAGNARLSSPLPGGAVAAAGVALDEINFQDGVSRRQPRVRAPRRRGTHHYPAVWLTEGIFVAGQMTSCGKQTSSSGSTLPGTRLCCASSDGIFMPVLAGTNRIPGLRSLSQFLVWSCAYYRRRPRTD